MPVDPKEDVDICITCLTKTPPKLPLREELPSLGVELIYKARGMGANVSKREARRAAKDFRYTESFKDLKKRRLFPKSSRRIRGILEERRLHESELRHISSAVSYESYKEELYGEWVTDTSSSSQSKHSSFSSTATSVSEINTTRNRRMTKAALKRWRLFRKQSKRRKEKINRKKEEEKRKEEEEKKVSQVTVTTGSLIGSDVFADFLAPLRFLDEGEDDEGTDPSSLEDDTSPWFPDSLLRKNSDKKVSQKPSWYHDLPERKQSPAKSTYSTKSKPSEQSSYFDDDDFPPVGLADDTPPNLYDSKSPTPISPSSNSYPDAKSPPPAALQRTPISKRRGKTTPTTVATTPGPATSPEMFSVASSVTFSQKQTRREKLLGSNSKLSRFLSNRKQRHETGGQPCIQESQSQESNSDTSLIGLSVAFPKDEPVLDVPNISTGLTSQDLPRPEVEEVVDSYVSDDTENKGEPRFLKSRKEQRELNDTQPSGVLPANTFSWKESSLLGMGGVSQDLHHDPAVQIVEEKELHPTFSQKNDKAEKWSENQASSKHSDDMPEDLYQAFGRKDRQHNFIKVSEKKSLFPGKVVIPGEEEGDEIGSYHPIVPGTDIALKDEEHDVEDTRAFDQSGTLQKDAPQATSEESPKEQKRNSTFKWLNGGIQKIRNLGSKKADTRHDPDDVLGSPKTDSAKEEAPSELSRIPVASAPATGSSFQDQVINGTRDTEEGHFLVKDNESGKRKTEDHDVQKSAFKSSNDVHVAPGPRLSVSDAQDSPGPRLDDRTAFAFSDIPDEFYVALSPGASEKYFAAGPELEENQESLNDVVKRTQFMLSHYDTEAGVVRQAITEDPTLVDLKDREDGQMLLHRLSSSPFPPHIDSDGFLDLLLDDIRLYKEKLDVVFTAFPAASEVVDSDGDLPVHLLARNLMHWETTWYAKVYEQAGKESENPVPGGPATAAITTLYHTMSLCIETLLQRVVLDERLCRERGSMGSLLPLHIATIFTASVATLRRALESYPVGAVECASVKGFNSFVPDGALPIEIHESFCTDFPKWEVEVSGRDETKWSKGREVGSSRLEDSIRRSDLLFAYNPSIQSFRKDKARIRRIECRINFEARQVPETEREGITKASERLWIWMCTFTDAKESRAAFAKSVERILEDLPLSLVRMLATIPSPSGEAILDSAHPDCVAVIRDRLDSLSESITPIPTKSESTSKVLQSWDESLSSKLSQVGKINLGQVCRAIFNIKEKDIPTSFVILPYKLARNANGTLGMSSAESAPVAVKFADCLLKLTDPRSILYFLDKKSESYFGVSMYEGADDAAARERAFSHVVQFEKSLLDLYSSRVAYLYLLDEETGVPLVPRSEKVYPMILHEPVSMVRKLLPMMIMGMVQMRGDKAVAVASATLLDSAIGVVPAHYGHAAKKMSIFLHWSSTYSERQIEDLAFIKSELNRFLASFSCRRLRDEDTLTGTTEWNVELSIIRMLFEVNDPKCLFSGLKKEEVTDEEIRWILDENSQAYSQHHSRSIPYGNDTSSEASDQSQTDSYTTFGADPLKFYQPPDDATETTYDTQATLNVNSSDAYVGLARTESDESAESERLRAKNALLIDTFGAKVLGCSDLKGDEQPRVQNPAEQVWVDVRNRLDVTGFFWDEAQITNLRVDLLQQASKLSSLQKRIGDIKQEESKFERRVEELFCRIMGDNGNVLEVPSPRSLFGARRLLARMSELETRLMENEVDAQHFRLGVATLNEEIIDLVPLEELSSACSSASSVRSEESSSKNQSCVSESDKSASSDIMTKEDADCGSSIFVSDASDIRTATQMETAEQELSNLLPCNTASSDSGGWNASRSIERIRKAFAAARRGEVSYMAARHALAIQSTVPPQVEQKSSVDESTSNNNKDQNTKLSTLTDSRSSALREKAVAARSRAINQAAAQSTHFPLEIALPMLDHRAATSSSEGSGGNHERQVPTANSNDENKSALQSESSSSFSFENTSMVQYDKETGRIEF